MIKCDKKLMHRNFEALICHLVFRQGRLITFKQVYSFNTPSSLKCFILGGVQLLIRLFWKRNSEENEYLFIEEN